MVYRAFAVVPMRWIDAAEKARLDPKDSLSG
jgi:hypothetical protein